ncbi:MAG TPA: UDP-N-acetylglucosamine--N-acetylmuramyl-(pentapeptide) pyrophosphoryl-undecaprenol N-acetylglucosamine transferase [Candidatus Tyrphobacter sp.]
MTVLFAAGGTGGHLYPAFAIAQALRARGDDVLFVGTRDRLEARLVPAAGFPLFTVAAHPLRRRLSFDLLRTAFANSLGVVQSLRILGRVRPDAVIATGGYVCVPVVVAARIHRALRRRKMPIALLEPNVLPGVANRVLAPRVDEIWNASNTGVPIRASLTNLPPRTEAIARLGLDPQRKTLLVFGGSQGARAINDALIALIETGALPEGWQSLLVTGARDYARVEKAVGGRAAVRSYLDDPADAFAAADLVLARAGASTLAELAALALPAILVPYPHAAEGHQQANAAAAAAAGTAVVIENGALGKALRTLLAQTTAPARLEAMRACARAGAGRDPVGAILARIDALAARKG